MSRRGLTAILALTLGSGTFACKRAEPSQTDQQSCDQDRLAALATELDAAEPDARVALVSEGLLAACGDKLYPTVHDILVEIARPGENQHSSGEDEALRAAIERICSNHAQIGEIMSSAKHERGLAVAELCGFSRYELLSETELRELSGHALFVWATHDWLLDSGTPLAVAKTISRALFRVHEEVFAVPLVRPLDGQRLVVVPATAPIRPGPVVYISATELVFNEQRLASLDAGRLPGSVMRGHMIIPLYEMLDEEVERQVAVLGEDQRDRVLVLAVDGGVSFASVVDAEYTAARLGFERFDLVVEPIYPIRRAIRADPPLFAADDDLPEEIPGEPPPPPRGPPQFRVVILDDGYRVYLGGDEPVVLAKRKPAQRDPAAWDEAGLTKLVRERTAADPRLQQGIVSAERDITMDVVLTTYAILLGPDCKQHEDGAGCLLPELFLDPGAG